MKFILLFLETFISFKVYNLYMKTIALNEKTFELIISSFLQKGDLESSMFGELKGKTKSFTVRERKEIWRD